MVKVCQNVNAMSDQSHHRDGTDHSWLTRKTQIKADICATQLTLQRGSPEAQKVARPARLVAP